MRNGIRNVTELLIPGSQWMLNYIHGLNGPTVFSCRLFAFFLHLNDIKIIYIYHSQLDRRDLQEWSIFFY